MTGYLSQGGVWAEVCYALDHLGHEDLGTAVKNLDWAARQALHQLYMHEQDRGAAYHVTTAQDALEEGLRGRRLPEPRSPSSVRRAAYKGWH